MATREGTPLLAGQARPQVSGFELWLPSGGDGGGGGDDDGARCRRVGRWSAGLAAVSAVTCLVAAWVVISASDVPVENPKGAVVASALGIDDDGVGSLTLAALTCPDAACGEGALAREQDALRQWCAHPTVASILVHVNRAEDLDAQYKGACPEKIAAFPKEGGCFSPENQGVSMKCFFDALHEHSRANADANAAYAFTRADAHVEGLDKAYAYLRRMGVGPYLALLRPGAAATDGEEGEDASSRRRAGAVNFFLTDALIAPFRDGEDDFYTNKPGWDTMMVTRYWRAGHLGLELTAPGVSLARGGDGGGGEPADLQNSPDDPGYKAMRDEKYGAGARVSGGAHTADATVDCSRERCLLMQREPVKTEDRLEVEGGGAQALQALGAEDAPAVDAVAARVALRARGDKNFVIAVALTDGYIKLFANTLCSSRGMGTNNIMVFAFDLNSYNYAMENDVPVVYAVPPEGVDAEDKYLSIGFQRIMLHRLKLLRAIVQSGINVVTMDADVVPMAPSFTSVVDGYFGAYQMFGQANLYDADEFAKKISGGFIGLRANANSNDLLGRVIDCQMSNIDYLRQNYADDEKIGDDVYIKKTEEACFQKEFDAIPADARACVTTVMDGYEYFEQKHPFDPNTHIALHHNYIIGVGAKIARMRDANLWTVPEDSVECSSPSTPQLGDEGWAPSALSDLMTRAVQATFYVLSRGGSADNVVQTLRGIEGLGFPPDVLASGRQFDVEIRVDASAEEGAVEEIESAAREMQTRYEAGQVRVVRDAHAGLTRAWMNVPSWKSEFVIIVEDDVALSPHILAPLTAYGELMRTNYKIFGYTTQYQDGGTALGRLGDDKSGADPAAAAAAAAVEDAPADQDPPGEQLLPPGSQRTLPCDDTVSYQRMSSSAPMMPSSEWRAFRFWMYALETTAGESDDETLRDRASFLREACTPGLTSNAFVLGLTDGDQDGEMNRRRIGSGWAQRYLIDRGKLMLHHQFCDFEGSGNAGLAVNRGAIAAEGAAAEGDAAEGDAAEGAAAEGVQDGSTQPSASSSAALITTPTPPSLPPMGPEQGVAYYDVFLRPASAEDLDRLSQDMKDRRHSEADPCVIV